jgi:PTH2 family peptidyl-tRNA hydrolase
MSPGKLAAQVSHCAEAYWTNLIRENCDVEYAFYPEAEPGKQIAIVSYKVEFFIDQNLYEQYVEGTFTKTICEAKNKTQLLKAKDKAIELGLTEGKDFGLIYDCCFTELAPEEEDGTTLTGIWFAPLPDETVHAISKKYQLYKGEQ